MVIAQQANVDGTQVEIERGPGEDERDRSAQSPRSQNRDESRGQTR
jgi:hypothetical protein